MSSFTVQRRWAAAGAALVVSTALVAGGCDGDAGVDYSSAAAFCQQVAQADCSAVAVQACYGADEATLQADTQTCVGIRSSLERCNPQNLPYNPLYAQTCVDAHAAVYATNPLDPAALAAMTRACNAVFNRGGERGAPCMADTDCAVTNVENDLTCVVHQGQGTCQTPFVVQAGKSCASPAAQCEEGYFCDAGGHCVEDPGKGGDCGAGVPCASGLRCDTGTRACAPVVADGEPCTMASDCVGQFCVGSPEASVCSSTFTLAVLSPTCSDFK